MRPPISAKEFVRRFKENATNSRIDSRYTLFLGAGCSIFSGITGATSLVIDYWLPRLKRIETGDDREIKEWVTTVFPKYTEENTALFYGPTIERLFLDSQERQKEIERLVGGKDPDLGFAVLAQQLSNQGSRGLLNFLHEPKAGKVHPPGRTASIANSDSAILRAAVP